jgi:hypothetical protein
MFGPGCCGGVAATLRAQLGNKLPVCAAVSKRPTTALIAAALASLPIAGALAQGEPTTERASVDQAGEPFASGVTAASISPDGLDRRPPGVFVRSPLR